MSEMTWTEALKLELEPAVYENAMRYLKQDLAAAEERGRRAGIEEVGRIADELERVMYEVIGCGREGSEMITPPLRAVLDSLRALAPRDSGKEKP